MASGGSQEFSSSATTGLSSSAAFSRVRAGQPITGLAAARPEQRTIDFVAFPLYGPWGQWYPWYGGGFGYGFVTYNPWRYGAASWFYSPFGIWYDPYRYWDPFYGGGYYRDREDEPKAPKKTTGSVRIKANVETAKVYVDGALVGTVEEFSGLSDHLVLEGGRHTLELRADGYETKSIEINVKVGSTKTERVSLKEKK